jgi:hypothetical protein
MRVILYKRVNTVAMSQEPLRSRRVYPIVRGLSKKFVEWKCNEMPLIVALGSRTCCVFGCSNTGIPDAEHGCTCMSKSFFMLVLSLACRGPTMGEITRPINSTNCLWYPCFQNKPGQGSRYSAWLRAGWPTGRSLRPGRSKNFFLTKSSRPSVGSTQPPVQWVPGVFPRG